MRKPKSHSVERKEYWDAFLQRSLLLTQKISTLPKLPTRKTPGLALLSLDGSVLLMSVCLFCLQAWSHSLFVKACGGIHATMHTQAGRRSDGRGIRRLLRVRRQKPTIPSATTATRIFSASDDERKHGVRYGAFSTSTACIAPRYEKAQSRICRSTKSCFQLCQVSRQICT